MLGGDHPIGGQEGQCPAPVALAEHQAEGGGGEGDQVGETPGDLPGETAVLGLRGEGGASGVDDGDQRQLEVGGQPHAPPRLTQRVRTHRLLDLAAAVLAEEDAW